MEIIIVKSVADRRNFLDLVDYIYKGDKQYIRPLDPMIESCFDEHENVCFKRGGSAVRFLLKHEGKYIGRIAAFINKDKAYGFEQPTGGCGFFECIDQQEAANMLFNAAREWLAERGMEAMDGPINFGENENFWGLLVAGFTPPGIGMNYNPAYYQMLFENYGFQVYFKQETRHLDIVREFPSRFWKIAEWVAKKPIYSFEHFKMSRAEKYIEDIIDIHAEAWKSHENFRPLSKKDMLSKFREMRHFLVEDFIWLAYHEGEPIGFFVMYPDLNQIFKHTRGKLNWWNKLKLLYLFKKRSITRGRVVILGVKPKYQKHGIESAIFWHLSKAMKKHPEYTELELSWVGDFNPKMQDLMEAMKPDFGKTHYTYRFLFNESGQAQVAKKIVDC